MAKLIDADALKAIFQKWADVPDYNEAERHIIRGAIYEVDAAPTVNGWISVYDRLPEEGRVVLAFGTRSATTGMFQGVRANDPTLWMWKNHMPKHVSHWMPLPESPKENE